MSTDRVGPDGRIAVVIPYFQRNPGILARTVRSVLAQTGVGAFPIVVVDDASPVPAREELKGLMHEAGDRIVLVEQPNAGAAGARNKGLDSLPTGTQFVAFVDSDDEWNPAHLSNALFALNRGFDFYFADFYQLGQSVTAFARAGKINVADHPLVEESTEVREYRGDMVDQIITGNILGTSVTAYAYGRMPDLRFRLGFRHTGEEYLFWMDLALRSRRIAFGDRPECRYGSGVNIFSEASWGQEKFLSVIVDDIKYRRRILEEYSISRAQRRALKSRIRELRRSFTAGLLHHVRTHRRLPSQAVLRGCLSVDPWYSLAMWPAALEVLLDKRRA
ncbi:MAG: glycosyltransferase family 2 protein [Betaproteobacteria bacterium]